MNTNTRQFHLILMVFVTFLFVTIQIRAIQASDVSPESLLLSHLLDNGYNSDARPSPAITTSVNLTYDIALRQVLDLDEKKQIMTTSTWIRHYWNDPYLTWNPKNWSDISYVTVMPERVWKPDITLYNNAEREFQGLDDFGKTRITIYSNGNAVWLIPVILLSECRMEMNNFPFDTQSCPLTFGSWAYDGLALDFWPRNGAGDMSSFAKNGEFNIYGLEAKRVSVKYNCCPNPYVTITYTVHLQRRVKFFLYNLIIPGILIAFLSCFSFFLPPLSGERTGLIITNFLSLSVYVLMISDSVPPSSDSVPTLVGFYTVMISQIGIALILNCCIIPLAEKRVPVPKTVRKIILHYLAKVFMCTSCRKTKTKNENDDVINANHTELNNSQYKKSNTNYDVIFENKQLPETNHVQVDENMTSYIPKNYSNELINFLKQTHPQKLNHTEFENSVVEELKKINEYLTHEGMSRDIENDWEEVIRVLDRIFFLLFGITTFASAAILMLDVPEIAL